MSLRNYRQVALGKRRPAYLRAAEYRCATGNLAELGTDELWALHDHPSPGRGKSLLDLKIELADRMLRKCALCERRCGVDRTAGETGFCGVGGESRCFFEQILWGEEEPLIPSHEVFFSGCNMRCRYCYSWEAVLDPAMGKPLVPEELAGLADSRRREGAANLNLIGGEPTVSLPGILKVLKHINCPTAVVWNSNFFMSEEAMKLLNGIVDLYVGDFRFGNDQCASEIAATDGYFEAAARNFELAARSGAVIIRHLVMPGHVECCLRPIAEWMAAHLPGVPFNLMFQYTPCFKAVGHPVLGKPLSRDEEKAARGIVKSLRLNTRRWRRPLPGRPSPAGIGSGEFGTSITIRPDGRVTVLHLHSELLGLVRALNDNRK